jgi:hypothetical protein
MYFDVKKIEIIILLYSTTNLSTAIMNSRYKNENNDFMEDIELGKPVYKNKIRHTYKLDYNYLVTTIIIIVIYIATINYISKTTKQVQISINDISTHNKQFNEYVSNKNKETQILKDEIDASKQFSYKLEEQLNDYIFKTIKLQNMSEYVEVIARHLSIQYFITRLLDDGQGHIDLEKMVKIYLNHGKKTQLYQGNVFSTFSEIQVLEFVKIFKFDKMIENIIDEQIARRPERELPRDFIIFQPEFLKLIVSIFNTLISSMVEGTHANSPMRKDIFDNYVKLRKEQLVIS